jgi:signal transduction histidine kinase/CheY-like chemotaxis protein/HPt (histidine-containing phosphotransfer) domain-containing protein
MYLCGIFDIIDILFLGRSFHLFHYSIFMAQIGMTFTLMERLSGIYKRLEEYNVQLETAVRNRTIELEKQTEIAINASKAKSEFLANMSHEIRTPMNSIVGFSELALYDDVPPKTREYIGIIKENTIGLLSIIDDVLDISKVESGRMELELVPFDLRDLLVNCRETMLQRALGKGLTLNVNISSGFNKLLLGDPTRLRQVLLNLLSNAVKFTNVGVVNVSADIISEPRTEKPNLLFGEQSGNVVVHFEVSDSGIGISREQIQYLFEPFTQADASITRKYGGTGLGLPIAKNLIELMGGALKVESIPGVGSKFNFDIAFKIVDENSVKQVPGVFPISINRNEKFVFDAEVLVCEDNPPNQLVIIGHLARFGIKAVIAENGREGVELVKERCLNDENGKPFDLIFMDIQMPVMDGIEAASIITSLTRTPIVAMTANIMSHEREIYAKSGMTDYLGKPFTSAELVRCLLKYLKPTGGAEQAGIFGQAGIAGHAGDQSGGQSREQSCEQSCEQDEVDIHLKKRFENNFLNNAPLAYQEIRDAVNAGDNEKAYRLAHTLAGNAALIGRAKLRHIASNMEQLLKDSPPNGVNRLPAEHKVFGETLVLLKDELEAVANEIRNELKNNKEETIKNEEYVQLSAEEAFSLLDRLETMLKERNPQCMTLLDDIRAIPGTEDIVTDVENFDFKPAINKIRKKKDEIKNA